MKKIILTLNIGNYAPEITAITYPTIRAYAEKIGATFAVIDQHPFQYSITANKFLVPEYGRGYDWVIYLDSDTIVNPNAPDWTAFLDKDDVLFYALDTSPLRFRATKYNSRSRSYRGACTWCVWASDWTVDDLWTPYADEADYRACQAEIFPMVHEANSGVCQASHLCDDYQLTQNLARFGLHTQTITEMGPKLGITFPSLYHLYAVDNATKVKHLAEVWDFWISQKFTIDDKHRCVVGML
jgi:hypothetical protein